MKLRNFDEFIDSLDTSVFKQAAVKHFANAFPEEQEYADLEEVIRKYNECSSRAYGEMVMLTFRAYHEWLQDQLKSQ